MKHTKETRQLPGTKYKRISGIKIKQWISTNVVGKRQIVHCHLPNREITSLMCEIAKKCNFTNPLVDKIYSTDVKLVLMFLFML